MPKCPKRATAPLRPSETVRPDECTTGLVRCMPISSGGHDERRCTAGSSSRSSGSRLSLVQMRSVRSRMPRSTRAPPDAQLSISSPGWRGLELVEQPVHGERVLVHAGDALRAAAGIDEVAVVVPLQVRDRVLVEQRVQARGDVGVRLRVREVEHLLLPRGRRQRHPAAQDPVRMLPREVAVGVDHLGLDPQAELHAEVAHVVDRAGAGRPARRPRRRTSRRGPAVSSRRPVNQPSSSTKRSTPTPAAASASAVSFSSEWSKYTASHVLSVTGPGPARMLRPRAPLVVEAGATAR